MSAASGGGLLSRRAMATVAIMLATIMQAVDSTIANVALPTIQGAMSATADQVAWVLTSYVVASAIMTAPAGFLASRFGRRRLIIVSVVGFTITSMLCGMATSINELVIYRVLQGMLGAALVPISQAILLDSYPPEKHGQAMSIWGVGIMIGPILGPTLGGYITEWLDWRWVFFINLPIGILTLIGLLMFVDETPKNRSIPFDWTGFALLSIAICSFQLLLDRGETLDWLGSTEIIIELTVAALCFYLFVVHIFTSRQPFISTALFKDRNYFTSVIVIFIMGSLLLATMALLPPFLEGLLGYPVDLVGEVMAPRGVGSMLSMMIAGRLINRVDARVLVALGFGLSTLSLWQMTQFNLEITPWYVVNSGFIQGLGLGLIIVPLSTIAYVTLHPSLRNEGTAMFSLVRNLGSSFGLSLVMAQLINSSQRHRADLVNHIGAFEVESFTATMSQQFSSNSMQSLAMLDQMVNEQAMTMAFLDDFRLIMFASAAVIPLLFFMRPPPKQPSQSIAVEA